MATLINKEDEKYIQIKIEMAQVLANPEPEFSKYPTGIKKFFAKRMKQDILLIPDDDDPNAKKLVKVMYPNITVDTMQYFYPEKWDEWIAKVPNLIPLIQTDPQYEGERYPDIFGDNPPFGKEEAK